MAMLFFQNSLYETEKIYRIVSLFESEIIREELVAE